MAIKSNDAYEGRHTVSQHLHFTVAYKDKHAIAPHNAFLPYGHHERQKAGWYWVGHDGVSVGPFTSSRKAYQAAYNECKGVAA